MTAQPDDYSREETPDESRRREVPGPVPPDRIPAAEATVADPATAPGPADAGAADDQPAADEAAGEEVARPRIAEPGRPGAGVTGRGSGGPAAVDSTAGPDGTGYPDADGPGRIPATGLAAQQWPGILALFVDDPRGAVERADAAAGELAAALVASLEREQAALRASWTDNASTEELRTALQQYRSFCDRLQSLGLS